MATQKQERSSNVELFRIILMVFLIASHYIHNSGILDEIYTQSFGLKTVIMTVFGMWGKPIINSFLVITGYYMCLGKTNYLKWIRFLCQVLFYNIVIYLLFVAFGITKISASGIINNVLPIKSIWTDFVSCYLIFYLLIPFINILIQSMDKRQHFTLLIILGFVYVVLGTTPKIVVTMNYISWFTFVYILASFFRLYCESMMKNKRIWIAMFCLIYSVSILSVVAGLYISYRAEMRLTYYLLEDSNKLLAVLLGFSFFGLFYNMNIKQSKFINAVASTTFGVLLIHANSDLMRKWLWEDLLKCTKFFNSQYYIYHAVICVLGVYIACVVIDLIRQRIIEKPLFKALEIYRRKSK